MIILTGKYNAFLTKKDPLRQESEMEKKTANLVGFRD